MRNLILTALLFLPAAARAQTGCQLTSGPLKLEKPRVGITPINTALACINRDLDQLSFATNPTYGHWGSTGSAAVLYVGTFTPIGLGAAYNITLSSDTYIKERLQVGTTVYVRDAKVGIGGVPASHSKLNVLAGDIVLDVNQYLKWGNPSAAVGSNANELRFYSGDTVASAKMTLDATGRLGVGATSPNGTLDLSAGTSGSFPSASIGILSTNANAVKNWAIGSGRGSNWEDLSFWAAAKGANPHTTGTEVLTLGGGSAATGFNVGIRNSSPAAMLHVSTSASDTTIIGYSPLIALGDQGAVTGRLAEIALGWRGNGYSPATIGYQQMSNVSNTNGDLYFATRLLTTASAPIERMRITAAGNLGVGTATPLTPLDVNGAATVRGSTTFLSTVTVSMNTDDSGVLLKNAANGNSLASLTRNGGNDRGNLLLYSAGTLRTLIQGNADSYINSTSGNLGIGTASPGTILHIKADDVDNPPSLSNTAALTLDNPNGAGGIGGQINFRAFTGTNNTAAAIGFNTVASDATGSRGNLIFATKPTEAATTLTTRLIIADNGSLTLPGSTLTVRVGGAVPAISADYSGTESIAEFKGSDTGAGARIDIDATGAGGRKYRLFATGSATGGDLSGTNPTFAIKDVTASDVTRLAINSSGNVGVGTSNPNLAKLHVAGDAAITTNLRVGNSGPSDIIHIGKSSSYNIFLDHTATGAAGNTASFQFRANDTGGSIRNASAIQFNTDTPGTTFAPGYITFRTVNAAGTDGERVRIDKQGNVGINESSPNTKLQVSSGIVSIGGSGSGLVVTSSVTIGPPQFTSTATYEALLVNGWSMVASTHPAGATESWFYNMTSTAPALCSSHPVYRLEVNLVQNASDGAYAVQFSTPGAVAADATSGNYRRNADGTETGAGSLETIEAADTGCPMGYPGGAQRVDYEFQGGFQFGPVRNNDHRAYGETTFFGHGAGTGVMRIGKAGCEWGYSARIGPLYGLRFFVSAGTYTGDLSLWFKCAK